MRNGERREIVEREKKENMCGVKVKKNKFESGCKRRNDKKPSESSVTN